MISLSKSSPTTPKRHAALVWALPCSLATTWGIIVIFFSSGYLDVSVLRVGSLSSDASSMQQVVPFGNLRINGCMHLPEAYRSLPRPSSPLSAKASAIRPYFALKILKSASADRYKYESAQLKKRIITLLLVFCFL